MAEIRSTMDMVMDRAAKMCAEANDNDSHEDILHAGMRTGADYLNGKNIDFASLIKDNRDNISLFTQGLLQTFMRQISLPRDDSQPWESGLGGITALADAWPVKIDNQLDSLISEIRNTLSRYQEHKQQIRQQLENNFATQAAQLEQNLAKQTGMRMNISPAQHPKFQEEWQKVETQLNDQYLNAVQQYKDAITDLF